MKLPYAFEYTTKLFGKELVIFSGISFGFYISESPFEGQGPYVTMGLIFFTIHYNLL